jgi:hypothetical protein
MACRTPYYQFLSIQGPIPSAGPSNTSMDQSEAAMDSHRAIQAAFEFVLDASKPSTRRHEICEH